MNIEKIKVRVTQSGQTMDVVVFSKRADCIEVVIGEGVHNVKCQLTPTRNGLAYAGSVMGREIVYERSREQVQADIEKFNPHLPRSTRRRCANRAENRVLQNMRLHRIFRTCGFHATSKRDCGARSVPARS
jgi:DUF2075 family protein